MHKFLFILNPTAGGGRAKKSIPLIEETMKFHKIPYEIKETSAPFEATKLAEEGVDFFHSIIAVGGDGTVNEVAKGLINRKKGILGVIPCGTGNDFARALGIEPDINKALDIIIKGQSAAIDIGKINGFSFLNIASVGFDTAVVIQNDKIKKKIKSELSYIVSLILTLFNYRRQKATLLIDDVLLERNLVLLAVGNGICYGGGLAILPMAKIDDGYFHIAIVKNISNLKLLLLFPSIFKGEHLKYTKYVEIHKGKKVIYKNKEEMNLNIDGEIVKIEDDIVFEIDNYKLQVIHNTQK